MDFGSLLPPQSIQTQRFTFLLPPPTGIIFLVGRVIQTARQIRFQLLQVLTLM